METPRVLVVMGVAGCGKSTVGRALAERLGWPFQEGDDLHPVENVAKMRRGEPLTDADRAPWLDRVGDWIGDALGSGGNGVITCSALKHSYRRSIRREGVVFVHLAADRGTLERRLTGRDGHYMGVDLLASQLDALEEPDANEAAFTVDVSRPLPEVLDDVLSRLVPTHG